MPNDLDRPVPRHRAIAGGMTLSEAIEHFGPLLFPEWDRSERSAPKPAELAAQLYELSALDRRQLATAAKARVAEIERFAQADLANGSTVATPGPDSYERIATDPTLPAKVKARLLADIAKERAAAVAPADRAVRDRREALARDWLSDKVEQEQASARAALRRWLGMHGQIQAATVDGRLRPIVVAPDGMETLIPSNVEWQSAFPAPFKDHAHLPRLGDLPSLVLFDQAQLDLEFGEAAAVERSDDNRTVHERRRDAMPALIASIWKLAVEGCHTGIGDLSRRFRGRYTREQVKAACRAVFPDRGAGRPLKKVPKKNVPAH